MSVCNMDIKQPWPTDGNEEKEKYPFFFTDQMCCLSKREIVEVLLSNALQCTKSSSWSVSEVQKAAE